MMAVEAFGNSIYKQHTSRVEDFSAVGALLAQLRETQQQIGCPVLTAKHVGINVSAFVIDLNHLKRESQDFSLAVLNPVLKSTAAPLISRLETDPSLPGLELSVERPQQIIVSFSDDRSYVCERQFSDLAAAFVMQGIDLLQGITLLDRVNSWRQRSVNRHIQQVTAGKIETDGSTVILVGKGSALHERIG